MDEETCPLCEGGLSERYDMKDNPLLKCDCCPFAMIGDYRNGDTFPYLHGILREFRKKPRHQAKEAVHTEKTAWKSVRIFYSPKKDNYGIVFVGGPSVLYEVSTNGDSTEIVKFDSVDFGDLGFEVNLLEPPKRVLASIVKTLLGR